MSYIIPRNEIPQEPYHPIKVGDVMAMLTITPTGPVIMYPDEVLYVPWSEIAAYAMTSDKQDIGDLQKPEPPQEPAKELAKHETVRAGVREVKK